VPTKNPKVSAYIPQHIFDRFQSFCQEKEMSMSQATAVVFAGYFEIEPEVNHLSGLLADRIQGLELKLSELNNLSGSSVELQKDLVSKLRSELTDVLLREVNSSIEKLQKSLIDRLEIELNSKLRGSLPNQLDLGVDVVVDSKKSAKSIPEDKKTKARVKNKNSKPREIADGINSLTANQLGERLKLAAGSIINRRSEAKAANNIQQFINWSKGRDPEKHGWEYRDESPLFYKVVHQPEPLA
jgi:hypothetical protein